MAHFAYIQDGTVQRVEPIVNEVIATTAGNDSELKGKRFMVSLYPETIEDDWVQTSYSGSMRGKYAGIGDLWDGTNFTQPAQPVSEVDPIQKSEKDATV
tara:strand:- start:2646 stop:2942 length:297 start_codon:yes stop_codon:yes gene_type:complete